MAVRSSADHIPCTHAELASQGPAHLAEPSGHLALTARSALNTSFQPSEMPLDDDEEDAAAAAARRWGQLYSRYSMTAMEVSLLPIACREGVTRAGKPPQHHVRRCIPNTLRQQHAWYVRPATNEAHPGLAGMHASIPAVDAFEHARRAKPHGLAHDQPAAQRAAVWLTSGSLSASTSSTSATFSFPPAALLLLLPPP